MRSGNPTLRMRDSTFNSLIQNLFALAKEHYQTINFVDMEKYKPTLPSRLVSQRPVTAPHKRLNITAKYHSKGNTGKTVQPSQAIPSTNQPLLNEYAALGKLLSDYIDGPSAAVAQVPNQFKALPDVTFNYGAKNVIGVDTFRVRSW